MKHSESVKIYRYHGKVRLYARLFYWQSLSKYLVSVANDNVNNDVIVYVALFCCYFHHASFIWLTGEPRTLPGGGGGGGGGGGVSDIFIYT